MKPFFSNRTVTTQCAYNIQHIGHFHIAGNPGRHEVDETQKMFDAAIMRAIPATDYDSYIGRELIPGDDANWVATLQQVYNIGNVRAR